MSGKMIPRLAIMGHPNAGKSSVVATLTENDLIQIDKRAGTTTESSVYPVVIDGRPVIEFIDTPADIRDKYQYFTEAKMDKLRSAGYESRFYSLEEGIEEYVQEFLIPGRCF